MKTLLSAAMTLSLLVLGATALVQPTSAAAAATPQLATSKQSPFYCDLAALTPERRKRHFDVLGPALIAKRKAVRELPDGYEFEFPTDSQTYQQVAEWIDAERVCCPFFEISLHAMPEGGPLRMQVTGRPGTKGFMQADGAEWIDQASIDEKVN